jgi:hypothetical protein
MKESDKVWERENSWSQEAEVCRMDKAYHEFEIHMNKYKKENESGILNFARDLYMVVTFLGVAYLILQPIL